MINAHRGDWRAAPENSLAAIVAARTFDVVEIDVRLSADGVPFLMHDPTLLRTAGRPQAIRETSSTDLGQTKLLGTTETVPTLARGLDVGGPSLFWDIDVKDPAELEAVARFLSTRPERTQAMVKRDVRDQADLDALLALQDRYGVPVMAKIVLSSASALKVIERARDADVIAAEVQFANASLLERACETGLPISVFTLDEIACDGFSDMAGLRDPAAVWGHLINIGVRVLMTDVPAALAEYLATRDRTASTALQNEPEPG